MRLTGAAILIECLKEQGVDTVFGYPGGAVLNIYDELYKQSDKIRHILTSHEQGAAHAADGFARSTGKVGVCLATSGPGATNLVTGIATAFMDSVPMVAITGNVPMSLLGKDSFQEVDITGITMPITKHNYIVKDVNNLADVVREAFYIAQEGRPGPVLIDIPKDITAQIGEYQLKPVASVETTTHTLSDEEVETALELVAQAKQPLIYAGGGVGTKQASGELLDFATKIQAPVCCSLMGFGAIPGDHPLFTGMIGMHGTKTSNLAATHCDLLIAIGARFSDRVVSNIKRFAPKAKVLHIDIDPAEVDKNVRTHQHIIGDVGEVLARLNQSLRPCKGTDWLDQIEQWKAKFPLKYNQDGALKPQYIMEQIHEVTNGDALIATEVGQNQIWAAQFFKYNAPKTLITSGGLGTMGYGLGAAIGAQIGNPDKRVFNIAGDGSFRMNCNELATAVEYNLPVIIVILNNRVLGMVRQWQDLFYGKRFSNTTIDRNTDFVKLAEAYGAVGFNLTKPEDVKDVLEKALAAKRPVVINCEIDRDERVLPIVPPGAAIQDVITEE